MKAVVASNGSRGDFQPMLALAYALKQGGHDVVLCGTPSYSSWAQELGVPFQPSGLDLQRITQANKDSTASPMKLFRRSFELLHDEVVSQFKAVREAADGVDLLISGGTQISGGSVAVHTGATHVGMFYAPIAMPSSSHAPYLVPWVNTPRWLNRFLWWGFHLTTSLLVGRTLNRQRKLLELPPAPKPFHAVMPNDWVLAADPELCPLPEDLRDRCTQTAAITLAGDDTLPLEVEAFLQAGSAPVYLGFGSMVDQNVARTTRVLVDAVQAAGVRAILSKGWAGLGEEVLPPSCLAVGPISHHALFPRMAAIVHHGGAGTVAAAARAGLPQIIVPHIVDQFYFGHRIMTLGLGPPPIPRPKLTAPRLAEALKLAVGSEPMRQRAREMAEQLRARDGVKESVRFLEQLAARRPKAGGTPL